MTKVIGKRSQRDVLSFAARRWLLTGEKNLWYFIIRDQAPEDIWETHRRGAATLHHQAPRL
jgi:hypothetical protein